LIVFGVLIAIIEHELWFIYHWRQNEGEEKGKYVFENPFELRELGWLSMFNCLRLVHSLVILTTIFYAI